MTGVTIGGKQRATKTRFGSVNVYMNGAPYARVWFSDTNDVPAVMMMRVKRETHRVAIPYEPHLVSRNGVPTKECVRILLTKYKMLKL